MEWKAKSLMVVKLIVTSLCHQNKDQLQVRNAMLVERALKETDFTMAVSLVTLAVLSLGGQLSRRRKMSARRMGDVR